MAADPYPRSPRWSRLRLVLVGFLLAADALVLASLVLARPSGWVAAIAMALLPASAHAAASLGFAAPVYVDKTLAGGEPSVAYAPKSGRLVYTAHEGTTHLFSSNIPGAPAESGGWLADYRNQVNI